jgi:1-acyl-sn-glycerol-3-phosphate acyltransferase
MEEINIRKVFKDKSPKLARLLPGFVYSYVEKIVHQDGLNDIIRRHGNKFGVEFAKACMKDFNVSIDVVGLENLPNDKRYLFSSNHPLGGFDGIILMSIIGEKFGNVRALVNDILMNIENLRPVFLPINKHGGNAKENVKLIDEVFMSDIQMLTFPAGLCSRKIKGEIVDLEWKKNFIVKAVSSKRDIVPVHFTGRNSEFFYNLSNFRKRIGIKVNIEMFYLVNELYKHTNGKFIVVFGKPIPYSTFDNSKTSSEWADLVKKHVYSLKNDANLTFN